MKYYDIQSKAMNVPHFSVGHLLRQPGLLNLVLDDQNFRVEQSLGYIIKQVTEDVGSTQRVKG